MPRMRWFWASGELCAGLAGRTFQYLRVSQAVRGTHLNFTPLFSSLSVTAPGDPISVVRNTAALYTLQGQTSQAAQRETDTPFP